MKHVLFDPARHDPADPNPWMAVYLDRSLPIADAVKRAWLTDSASRSRQWLLPLVRPFARLAIILVQLLKLVLPRAAQSSTLLHWVIARALERFATPEANWLILRHFHIGAMNLAWLNANIAQGAVSLDTIRPRRLDDLRDHMFVRHDINLYNFIIGLNLHLQGRPITALPLQAIDFSMLPEVDEGDAVGVSHADQPRGTFNRIDLHTAIELFTPVYALFLSDSDFWRATHSLQLDETIASYGAALTGRTDALLYVNNRHPMIPDITMNGAFRLLLHGLATEVMFAVLMQLKRAQSEQRAGGGGVHG